MVLCEYSLRGGIIVQQRCIGRSAIIRWLIVISKPQIFPFKVRVRITFATSSQYDYLLVIWRFSLTNLTIYTHAMNWTASASMTQKPIAHLLCYLLEHFWSRIEVLHVCHLVVGNTKVILHQIRNYSLFHEVWRLVAILRLWRLEG